jgi:hypothetical protein
MPGLHIDLTDEEYEAIPKLKEFRGKKRPWATAVLKEAIRAIMDYDKAPAEAVVAETVFSFRVKGKTYSGPGSSAVDAAKRLGLPLDPTMEWVEGTFESNLLDV